MAQNLKVFGVGKIAVDTQSTDQYNVPTNPKFTAEGTFSSSIRASDSVEQTRLYSLIYPNHLTSAVSNGEFTEVGTSTANTIRFNLATTNGSRIKCYDANTGTGVILDSTNYDSDYYYFVLIHAKNHLKHHFARVTKVLTEDTEGDAFTFEPALGNEIEIDTDFMLFKGSHKTTTAVAFSAGIKQDLQNSLVCSKPLFYFLRNNEKHFTANLSSGSASIAISTLSGIESENLQVGMKISGKNIPANTTISLITATTIEMSNNASSASTGELITIENYNENYTLDKDDQLNHNIKYTAAISTTNSSGQIQTFYLSVFMTMQDFSNKIMDYSKYSMKLELFDKLRELDENIAKGIGSGTANSNEDTSLSSYDYSDYTETLLNARRSLADAKQSSSSDKSGPTRYVHYDFSPKKVNIISNVLDMQLEESFAPRGGFSSAKIIDNSKMTGVKINNFEKYIVRHRVFRGDLSEFVDIPARVNAFDSSREYTFFTDFELYKFINVNDEVKIGDYILLVEGLPPKSGSTQNIGFYDAIRTEDQQQFQTASQLGLSWSSLLTADQKLQRRAFNFNDRSLLSSFNIVENREKELFVSIVSKDFEYLEADVLASDSELGLLYLKFDEKAYSNTETSMRYATGIFNIEIQRFTGKIEKIEAFKENQQNFIKIEGRDEFSQLLGPIVNRNTAFSEDIIYSTNSPYNTLTSLSSNGDFSFNNVNITNTSSISLTAGDRIFAEINDHFVFVGVIKDDTSSATTHELEEKAFAKSTGKALYKAITKNYMLTKALSSNPLVSSETSLKGSADKGIFFSSGTFIDSTKNASEGTSLVGTSSSNNEKGVGYFIHQPKGISSDNYFQCRLTNNDNSVFQTLDTVNTLLDFEILNISEENGNQVLEVAPYMPLSLGRVELNYANTRNTTFTDIGNPTATSNKNYFDITVTHGHNFLSSTSDKRNHHGKPVFKNGEFLGFITFAYLRQDYSTVRVFVDRIITTATSDTIQLLTYASARNTSSKLTQELHLLNGGHLWNGKIISLLNPNTTENGKVFSLDYPKHYNSGLSSSYCSAFGTPYYNIYNLEKGNINSRQIRNHISSIERPNVFEFYSEIPSKIRYYASTNKFGLGNTYSGATLVDNIIGTDKYISSSFPNTLAEARGFVPSQGSKFYDTTIHKSGGSADIVALDQDQIEASNTVSISSSDYLRSNPLFLKDYFGHIDAKIARMFLFSNSDLEPYSSLREDSLMYIDGSSNSKDITNYKLFAKRKSIETTNSDTKSLTTGSTFSIKNNDEDYVSCDIISADKTLSDLTRFSIMRLTELCLDWSFNQFDPENIPSKDKIMPPIALEQNILSVTNASNITAYDTSANTVTTNPAVNVGGSGLSNGDILYDLQGRLIGTVDSQSTNTITFNSTPNKTNGTSSTCALGYVITSGNRNYDLFSGNGKGDTFIEFGKELHMLKGLATESSTLTTGWGKFVSSGPPVIADTWYNTHSSAFGPLFSKNNKIHLVLPFAYNVRHGTTTIEKAVKLFDIFRNMIDIDDTGSNNDANEYADNLIPIFLDRYGVEDGKALASEGMAGADIIEAHVNNGSGATNKDTITMACTTPPFENNTDEDTNVDYDDSADGVFLGFKPKLILNYSNVTSRVTKGGESVYEIDIASSGGNVFLDFVDLTGCYLVSEAGLFLDSDGDLTVNSGSLDDAKPDDICYVVSHEIDSSNSTKTHRLILDNLFVSGSDRIFRIMQPNHTCFHSFSPKEIKLQMTSSRYTKMPSSNQCYNGINSFFNRNSKGGRDIKGNNEGILSMYVLVDCDNQNNNTSEKHTVIRHHNSYANILPSQAVAVNVSDGDNNVKTTIEYFSGITGLSSSINETLKFGQMKEMLGVVSVSETLNITVNSEIDTDFTRACIGSTLTVSNEADKLIDNLLKDNNIEADIAESNYPLFLAPNFQGVDLFSAVNLLLEKKDKSIIYEYDKFKVLDKKDNQFYSKVLLEENGDLQIYDLQKESNMFNVYNEIVVYGKNHRGLRKRSKSINKIGVKTLEVHEPELTSQEEVDERARVLREVHSEDDNNRLFKVSVGHSGISQLKSGDLIRLNVPRENVNNEQVIVLQIRHLLNGLMELQLGKFSKLLEDIFAELQVKNKTIDANLRKKEFGEQNIIKLDIEDTFKIKQLRLFVRKRTSASSFKLGFGTVLNTGTTTLGYGVGTGITFTTLIDEELI